MNGFSLIEILISLLILSLILLSFDAMEIYSLRENREAYFFSIAENQLHSMAERLRSHTDIGQQIKIWNEENQKLLPYGVGDLAGQSPLYTLTIFWGEKNHKDICDKLQNGIAKCITTPIHL